MKKIVMFLLCGGLLVACQKSAYSVKVSDGDKVLVSDSEMQVTKQGYFEFLLTQYGAGSLLDQSLEMIADKEVTDTKAIEKATQESIDKYAKYADGDLEKYAKKLGYASKDEFVEKVLRLDAKIDLLHKKYIQDNLDKFLKDYQVAQLKMISFDKESEALAFIKETKTEKDFDKKLKDKKGEDMGVVSNKTSTLDENLLKALDKLSAVKNDGLYSSAIKLSDDKYAVVYVYDTAHKNTDDIINHLTSLSDLTEEINGIYLKKYHFDVLDERVKDSVKKISSQYVE